VLLGGWRETGEGFVIKQPELAETSTSGDNEKYGMRWLLTYAS
jgi:hypothetical protein